MGDHGGGYGHGLIPGSVIGAEWGVGWGVVVEQVFDLAFEGADGAHVGVSVFDVRDVFALDTVLLVSGGKPRGGVTSHVIRGGL